MKCLYALAILALVLVLLRFKPFGEGFDEGFDEGFQAMKSVVICKADWCGHCKKIKPTWDKVSEKVNKDDDLKMVKINCGEGTPEQKKIMSKYDVDGYPTILIVDNGKATPYEGDRTEEALLKQIKQL